MERLTEKSKKEIVNKMVNEILGKLDVQSELDSILDKRGNNSIETFMNWIPSDNESDSANDYRMDMHNEIAHSVLDIFKQIKSITESYADLGQEIK